MISAQEKFKISCAHVSCRKSASSCPSNYCTVVTATDLNMLVMIVEVYTVRASRSVLQLSAERRFLRRACHDMSCVQLREHSAKHGKAH